MKELMIKPVPEEDIWAFADFELEKLRTGEDKLVDFNAYDIVWKAIITYCPYCGMEPVEGEIHPVAEVQMYRNGDPTDHYKNGRPGVLEIEKLAAGKEKNLLGLGGEHIGEICTWQKVLVNPDGSLAGLRKGPKCRRTDDHMCTKEMHKIEIEQLPNQGSANTKPRPGWSGFCFREDVL